jgi:hypothetical protein
MAVAEIISTSLVINTIIHTMLLTSDMMFVELAANSTSTTEVRRGKSMGLLI